METLYIDTNILLNVILEEEPFVETSFRLLKDIEAGKYSAVTSLLIELESISSIYFLIANKFTS